MSPFFALLTIGLWFTSVAMALAPRDAIHTDDLTRYDEFMGELADSHFLDMYLVNNTVQIDVYEHPSNTLSHSATFTPGENAVQYFGQEALQANEILETPSTTENGKRANTCVRKRAEETDTPDLIDKRRSRCYQYCGSIRNCRGNNGCPHCYAVRMGCLWQKWCR